MSEVDHPNCYCIDLRSAALRLTQIYDDALASTGLNITQFSLLAAIQSLDAPTLSMLASESHLERSTLGRNLKVLEKMEYIETRTGSDARSKTIHLSRKGKAAFRRAWPIWRGVQKELTGRLGADGRTHLDTLLGSLTEPLAAQSI